MVAEVGAHPKAVVFTDPRLARRVADDEDRLSDIDRSGRLKKVQRSGGRIRDETVVELMPGISVVESTPSYDYHGYHSNSFQLAGQLFEGPQPWYRDRCEKWCRHKDYCPFGKRSD